MPTARLVRSPSTDQGTFGVLRFGAQHVHTLELPWRENRVGRSCIPPGVYRCAMVNSPHLGHVYGVQDVLDRGYIRIHSANLAGDVTLGWQSELEGCIAPCQRVGAMRNKFGVMQAAGLLSRPAVNQLVAWAGGQPFTLEIT